MLTSVPSDSANVAAGEHNFGTCGRRIGKRIEHHDVPHRAKKLRRLVARRSPVEIVFEDNRLSSACPLSRSRMLRKGPRLASAPARSCCTQARRSSALPDGPSCTAPTPLERPPRQLPRLLQLRPETTSGRFGLHKRRSDLWPPTHACSRQDPRPQARSHRSHVQWQSRARKFVGSSSKGFSRDVVEPAWRRAQL